MCPWKFEFHIGNDSDGDMIMDICDECPQDSAFHDSYDNANDTDRDHIEDFCDNCPSTPNRDQFDSDAMNWRIGVMSPGDACDTSPAIRFWSIEEINGSCFLGVPIMWDEMRGPIINLKFAYTGLPQSGSPNSFHYRDVKNAFCDCEDKSYDDCISSSPEFGRNCSNYNHDIADPSIETGRGWLYLLKKRRSVLERGNVSKKFARLYIGENFTGQCPENPIRGRDWGCFEDDSTLWYRSTEPGIENIEADEDLIWSEGRLYQTEMQRFEWFWFKEPEIQTNTNPSCEAGLCDANYRIYLHPLIDSSEDYNDAFFYPPFGVASVHAECPPPDTSPGPIPQPIPIPSTKPYSDIDCAIWNCRDIFPEIFTIDTPEIPDWWRYTSPPIDSATGGIMIVGFDPYRGKIGGLYQSVFDYPSEVIDTIEFSSTLEPLQLPAIGVSNFEPMKIWIFGGRNLSEYKNDLWHGVPIKIEHSSAEYVYHWTKYHFPPNHIAPSPRGNSALFFEPESKNLILYGGRTKDSTAPEKETILSDLWIFDTSKLIWTQGQIFGDIPIGLRDFSVTQGIIQKGGFNIPFGFIWGGINERGAFSNTLYMLNLQSGEFHSYQFNENAPPGMTGSSLSFDPTSHNIHLYGGFDGEKYHNWLWTFNLSDLSWTLISDDCMEGTCPYITTSSALISYDSNDKVSVFPGHEPSGGYEVRPDLYFVNSISGWENSSQRESWQVTGDCDGDTIREDIWGSRCSTTNLWYHIPGKETCDTLEKSLVCYQKPLPEVTIYYYRIPGLKGFRTAGDLVFAGKGSQIISLDMRNPSSVQVLGTINLDGEIRDIEFWGNKLVVAQDTSLAILNVENPSSMVFERRIWTCGSVSAVEVEGNKAYFMTPIGIGFVNLKENDLDYPDYFGILVPVTRTEWEVIKIDQLLCEYISNLARGLPCGTHEGFEVSYGRGYAGIHKDFIIFSLSDERIDIESSLRFSSIIEAVRQEADFAYLNLRNGTKPLIYVFDPSNPQIVGEHTVSDWTSGLESGDRKIYRMRKNFIDIASVQ